MRPEFVSMVETDFFNGTDKHFFHVCTDGSALAWLFKDDHDYIKGINCIAICTLTTGATVVSYVLMDNHVHFVLQGTMPACKNFINRFKHLIGKYISYRYSIKGYLRGLPTRIIPIRDEEYLLSVLAYIDRNPIVAGYRSLPNEYRWGSARFLFRENISGNGNCSWGKDGIPDNTFLNGKKSNIITPVSPKRNSSPTNWNGNPNRNGITTNSNGNSRYTSGEFSTTITMLQARQRRKILGTHINFPQYWTIDADGMIDPTCFIASGIQENLFKTPARYLYFLSRKLEGEIDSSIYSSTKSFIPDKELRYIISRMARELFNCNDIRIMDIPSRLALARKLRYEYASSQKQIARMLHLNLEILKGYV